MLTIEDVRKLKPGDKIRGGDFLTYELNIVRTNKFPGQVIYTMDSEKAHYTQSHESFLKDYRYCDLVVQIEGFEV